MSAHTQIDQHWLDACNISPDATQPRERPVRCCFAGCSIETWNQAGFCSAHYVAPHMARKVLFDALDDASEPSWEEVDQIVAMLKERRDASEGIQQA